jgi:hypothetical protein
LTPGTKPLYVKGYKEKLEANRVLINHMDTQREIRYFGKRKNGSYGAAQGFHDDIALTVVEVAAFMDERNVDWLELIEILYSGITKISTIVDEFDDDDTEFYEEEYNEDTDDMLVF